MKYHAKFSRVFEVTIEADNIHYAQKLIEGVIKQFPADTCKMLSIHVDGYVEPVEPQKTPPHPPFGGNPGPSGGTPNENRPVVIELVDQIAAAA